MRNDQPFAHQTFLVVSDRAVFSILIIALVKVTLVNMRRLHKKYSHDRAAAASSMQHRHSSVVRV